MTALIKCFGEAVYVQKQVNTIQESLFVPNVTHTQQTFIKLFSIKNSQKYTTKCNQDCQIKNTSQVKSTKITHHP